MSCKPFALDETAELRGVSLRVLIGDDDSAPGNEAAEPFEEGDVEGDGRQEQPLPGLRQVKPGKEGGREVHGRLMRDHDALRLAGGSEV